MACSRVASGAVLGLCVLAASGCGSSASDASGGAGAGGTMPAAGSGSSGAPLGSAGDMAVGGAPDNAAGAGGAQVGTAGAGGASDGFWDPSNIPAAKNVMMFKFLNRTNGKYTDDKIFWSFKSKSLNEVHSFKDQPLYDMPANASGRLYFYLEAPDSKYYDFIEFTIGPTVFNGNTTRVDAFGLKVAMRMHCADGFDVSVGEDLATFMEDRAVTFQKFQDGAPAEFKDLAVRTAPYRIEEPGSDGFNAGGMYATYYDSFINELWSANGLTITKPGPNGSGLGAFPDISAAIFRHVGASAGTFSADGKLLNKTLWADASTFYKTAPSDYYAQFWHAHAINGKAYGFPYDDVGGYSSYISHNNPQYLEIAVGW
ncbi:MAG TPA: glycoside hydrolase family 64 protein [Polyangiaceae bacterium]